MGPPGFISGYLVGFFTPPPPGEIQPFQPSPQTSDRDLDMTRAIS
jgi:hypothetical protein